MSNITSAPYRRSVSTSHITTARKQGVDARQHGTIRGKPATIVEEPQAPATARTSMVDPPAPDVRSPLRKSRSCLCLTSKNENAVEKATTALRGYAGRIIDLLATGNDDRKVYALLAKTAKEAGHLPPEKAAEQLRSIFIDEIRKLPQAQRAQLGCKDYTSLAKAMKQSVDAKQDTAAQLDSRLEDRGLRQNTPRPQADGNAATIPVAALKEAATAVRLENLRAAFGGAFDIDDRGVVSGSSINRPVPESETNDLKLGKRHRAFSPAAFIEARTDKRLENPQESTTISGVRVQKDLPQDWQRIDFQFQDEKIKFSTLGREGSDNIVDARDFAGSDNAVTVLSSVLHQIDFPVLAMRDSNEKGAVIRFNVARGYKNTFVDLGNNNIEKHPLPLQLGALSVTITKNDAKDFVIGLSLELLTRSATIGSVEIAVHPDNPTSSPVAREMDNNPQLCLKVQLAGQLIISGESAAKGEISFDPASHVTRTYAGAFAMPL